ncbi:hypothetical protein [Sphingomonas xinjiangensis]|uniref:Uncharacterized protein n=1 Tax=Sphingomonas xinjiangensis TaxID=643568 RepID=A0A840YS68_9SPHN|nr:hypothetical protein [Sphingomonas xinjiangensis]MBB5712531.1 hypothetical protein [Sphingomonas xinjiangensis]
MQQRAGKDPASADQDERGPDTSPCREATERDFHATESIHACGHDARV